MKYTLQILVGSACLAAGSYVHAQLPAFNWVNIGNHGNPEANAWNAPSWAFDVLGMGSVPHSFLISAHETTNAQYAHFLNTVDQNGTNPNGLYSSSMASNAQGGITFNAAGPLGSKYNV